MTNRIITFLVLILMVFASCKEKEPSIIEDNFYLKNDGAEMPVFVRGNASSDKILVILHGGPGGSSLNHYYQIPNFTNKVEEASLVVYWEQRASGMSSGKLDGNDFTLDKMKTDLNKLLYVLAHRYGDKKIYLLGQSFGSLLSGDFISSPQVNDHNIAGWITIGGMYSFKDYSIFLNKYHTNFLQDQTSSDWDELKTKVAELDSTTYDLEVLSNWNSLGSEMQEKAREVGIANPRILDGLGKATFSGFYNPFTKIFNDLNTSELVFRDIHDLDLRSELEAANIPALWIHGEYDFVTTPNYGDSLKTFYGHPDFEHVVLDKGTHNPLATNGEETTELIVDFLNTH